jgi:hypothetical protein
MPFAEDQDMIQALAPERANQEKWGKVIRAANIKPE